MSDRNERRKRGEVASIAIAHLKTMDKDGYLLTYQIAQMGHCDPSEVPAYMSSAVKAGLVVQRKGLAGSSSQWLLGNGIPLPKHEQVPVKEDKDRKVTQTSATAVPSIFAYAAQRGAAAFSFALSTDGRLLIERYGRLVLELTSEERIQFVEAAARGDLTLG